MSYILLTRPLDDALEMEKNLRVPVVKAPLLEIELIPQKQPLNAANYTSLIVTSARSLTIFSQTSSFLQKPVWCVGNKTASMAKQLGFETIYMANNSAEELCQMIMAKTSSQTEKFLHICGESLHYDIVETLQQQGYQAEKCILYKTVPAKHFSEEILKIFANHQLIMIPVFSRKTAETLEKILSFHKLDTSLKEIVLVSCAEQIVEPLQKFKWQQIIIKQDLSAPALEAIYRKLESGEGIEMPQKKLWPLLAGTGITSLLLSLACFVLIVPRLVPAPKPVDVEKIQQAIITALKADQTEILAEKEKKINDLISQITALKQEVDHLKEQPGTLVKESPASLDSHLRIFIMAGQVEEQLKSGKADPHLWQEMKKLLLDVQTNLPEQVPALKEVPAAKHELLQDLKKLASEKSTATITTESAQKIEHPWLEKAEQYIGQIVIHKTESSPLPENQIPIEEQAIRAIETDDLAQIKVLTGSMETPDNVKEVLEKADERLSVLEGLKKIKSLLLQLPTQDRK